MILADKKNSLAANIGGRTGLILSALLALALLGILFSVPQPGVHVNQPFKAELLLSLFLMIFLAAMTRRAHQTHPDSKLLKIIVFSIGSFVLWSGISTVWGSSSGSVVHHTLLWSVYLIFFLLFTSREWPNANLRFIAATFVFVALILGLLCVFDYLTVVDFTSSEGPIRIRYGKYAELLVTISPLLWALAIYGRNQSPRRLLLIAGIISWLTVMLSLSKGAFIAGIIGFALFFTGWRYFPRGCFADELLHLPASGLR